MAIQQISDQLEITALLRRYYHHELTRTDGDWRSRNLREESLWFVNGPGG